MTDVELVHWLVKPMMNALANKFFCDILHMYVCKSKWHMASTYTLRRVNTKVYNKCLFYHSMGNIAELWLYCF